MVDRDHQRILAAFQQAASNGLADALERADANIRAFERVGEVTRSMAEAGQTVQRMVESVRPLDLSDMTPLAGQIGEAVSQMADLAVRFPALTSTESYVPPVFEHRNYELEAAYEGNRRLEELTRLLAESQEAQRETARLLAESQEAQRVQAKEHARREAERDARDEKTLQVTRRTYWVAVIALIVAVVAIVVSVIIAG